ncbi:MAG: hypothetical protein WHV44_00250 [Anaerolineales bacterium]
MAQSYFPFDTGAGSTVTEAQWSKMARFWRNDGVLYDALNRLEVYADSTGMQVKVRSGAAWIKGHYFESDAQETLPISAAHATLNRIDRVVVRLNWTTNTIALAVLTGTPASTPTAPALTQSSTIWEISLAQVYVGAAVSTIAAGNVTDERPWAAGGEQNFSIQVIIGNGIDVLTNGVKGYLEVPVDCYVVGWRIVSDVSGSVQVGVWRSTYATFPPQTPSYIQPAPSLTNQQKSENTTIRFLLQRGDWLAFNVNAPSLVKQLTVSLLCVKVR